MAIQTWQIPQHIKGDTFNSRKITFPFLITGCIIEMQFKATATGKTIFKWSTADGTFDVISATEMIMTERILDFPVYSYVSDLQIIFPDETVRTYFNAYLPIIQDITR